MSKIQSVKSKGLINSATLFDSSPDALIYNGLVQEWSDLLKGFLLLFYQLCEYSQISWNKWNSEVQSVLTLTCHG